MRAIAVRVDDVVGVAGFVVPGARVDVVVSISQQQQSVARVVVGNIQVLTAGTRIDQQQQQPRRPDGQQPATVVTLLVSPEDAERISLAASVGRITLTLRNPPTRPGAERRGPGWPACSVRRTPPPPAPAPPPRARARAEAPAPIVIAPPAAAVDLHRGNHPCGQAHGGGRAMSRTSPIGRRSALGAIAPVLLGASLAAQAPTPAVLPQPLPGVVAAPTQTSERVLLTAGRSTVLTTDFDITRIAVTNPAVADAVVVRPREVLVDGKGSGTVSLIVWGANERKHFDLVVDPGVTTLQQNFMQLFPTEDIDVAVTDEAVILSGSVSNNDVMLRAGELAKAAMPKHSVINMLALPSGSPSKQVMLQVRFAEVNRNALQQSGLTLFSTRPELLGRSTTQQFAAPDFTTRRRRRRLLQFSDFLNIFLFSQDAGHRRRAQGAAGPRLPAEPGRAQPDRLQRPGGQLPGRRRNSDSAGVGHRPGVGAIQGVRRAPDLHADHRR